MNCFKEFFSKTLNVLQRFQRKIFQKHCLQFLITVKKVSSEQRRRQRQRQRRQRRQRRQKGLLHNLRTRSASARNY